MVYSISLIQNDLRRSIKTSKHRTPKHHIHNKTPFENVMAHHLQQLKWYYFMTSTRILECEKCAIIDINTSHRCYLLAFMILNVVNTFSIGNRRTDAEKEKENECMVYTVSVCERVERERKKKREQKSIVLIVLVCCFCCYSTCSMRHLFDAKRMPYHLRPADTLNERLLIIVCFTLNRTKTSPNKTNTKQKTTIKNVHRKQQHFKCKYERT